MLRALYIGQESEDFAITVSLADKERPCSHGAGETIKNRGLSRSVSGYYGSTHSEFFRGAGGARPTIGKALHAFWQLKQFSHIPTHIARIEQLFDAISQPHWQF
jgi:hypothetical protein